MPPMKRKAIRIEKLQGGDERKGGERLKTESPSRADLVGEMQYSIAGTGRFDKRQHTSQQIDMEPPAEGKFIYAKIDGTEGTVRRVETPDGVPIAVFFPGSMKGRKARDR